VQAQEEDGSSIGEWIPGATYKLRLGSKSLRLIAPRHEDSLPPPEQTLELSFPSPLSVIAEEDQEALIAQIKSKSQDPPEKGAVNGIGQEDMIVISKWAFARFKAEEDASKNSLIKKLKHTFNPRWPHWRIVDEEGNTVPVEWRKGSFRFIESGKAEPLRQSLKASPMDPILSPISVMEAIPEIEVPATTDEEWARLNGAFASLGVQSPVERPPTEEEQATLGVETSSTESEPASPSTTSPPQAAFESSSVPSCNLSWNGVTKSLHLQHESGRRLGLLKDWFGSSDFYCFDPIAKTSVDVRNWKFRLLRPSKEVSNKPGNPTGIRRSNYISY
jgi:hypothetical protein